MQIKKLKEYSQLRQDIVSGDWVVIATGRAKRPHDFTKREKIKKLDSARKNCPFENPQASGHKVLLILKEKTNKNWFVMAVENKYPAFKPAQVCPQPQKTKPFTFMRGVGFHEVIITRPHQKTIAQFTQSQTQTLLRAYQLRYLDLMTESCAKYILIYHNQGAEAGATIYHPHSQIIAIPVIPPDVHRSLEGSARFWKKYRQCVHCGIVDWHLKKKLGIVYENDYALAVCPYASKIAFEVRIYPKIHQARFEKVSENELLLLADAFQKVMRKIYQGLNHPDYNFFIHTAPAGNWQQFSHYHWHLEILPKTAIWAGFELGSGMPISTIQPEDAARYLARLN